MSFISKNRQVLEEAGPMKTVQDFAPSLQQANPVASKYGSQCSKGLHTTVYLVTEEAPRELHK